ncbi:hypothetical protein ACGFYU_05745 [Streptomyces sp. NPDC048337]|uniref:hypothetical protein n=1 Tax=Streptomyces sp. NPDC048337 TaxID=3365535 RepID=UPI0037138FA5
MAAAVLASTWGLAVAGIVLAVMTGAPWNSDQGFFIVDTANALVYGLVAAVVLSRRLHLVGWLVALTAAGTGVAAVQQREADRGTGGVGQQPGEPGQRLYGHGAHHARRRFGARRSLPHLAWVA